MEERLVWPAQDPGGPGSLPEGFAVETRANTSTPRGGFSDSFVLKIVPGPVYL